MNPGGLTLVQLIKMRKATGNEVKTNNLNYLMNSVFVEKPN